MPRSTLSRSLWTAVILFLPSLLVGTPHSPVSWPAVQGDESGLSDRENRALESRKKERRLREGAEIVDRLGSFEWAGDRLNFVAEDGEIETKVLENRMMERVVQTLETSTGELQWKISGKITEYRENNYLLLTHVILKGKRSTHPGPF